MSACRRLATDWLSAMRQWVWPAQLNLPPLSPANLQDSLASCRTGTEKPHHSTQAHCTRESETAAPSLNVRTARIDVLLDGALAGLVVQVKGAPAPRSLQRKSLAKLHARTPPALTTTSASGSARLLAAMRQRRRKSAKHCCR